MRKIILIFLIAFMMVVLATFLAVSKPAQAYVYYGAGGRAWSPTRSFTGNYYGSGGLWGSYGGGYLYGPGNYGGWGWKSPTGRWWWSPGW